MKLVYFCDLIWLLIHLHLIKGGCWTSAQIHHCLFLSQMSDSRCRHSSTIKHLFVIELSKTCHHLNKIFKTLVIFTIAITTIIAMIIIIKFLNCQQQHVAIFHLIYCFVELVIIIILIIVSFIIFILTLSKGKQQTA